MDKFQTAMKLTEENISLAIKKIDLIKEDIIQRDNLMREFISLVESDDEITDEKALRYGYVLDQLKGILKL